MKGLEDSLSHAHTQTKKDPHLGHRTKKDPLLGLRHDYPSKGYVGLDWTRAVGVRYDTPL